MLDILENITKGKGKKGDIEELEHLAELDKKRQSCVDWEKRHQIRC